MRVPRIATGIIPTIVTTTSVFVWCVRPTFRSNLEGRHAPFTQVAGVRRGKRNGADASCPHAFGDVVGRIKKRTLSCPAYLRYVDDFALFSDSKRQLWRWKRAIMEFLQSLRLTIHEASAQVTPVTQGIPWLGFVVFPDHRRIKSRKVRNAGRRLSERFEAWQQGRISFAEFDANVQGWINHVRYADSWRLREQMLGRFVWGPESYQRPP
jgi:hypothetical protein